MSKTFRFPFRHRLITLLRDLNVRGIRGFAHRLPKWMIPSPKGALILETLHGFPMRIDPVKDQGVERSMYYTGTYERGTMDLLTSVLHAGDTFVDVGANIGLMTVHAARLVGLTGQVYAFEPNPETHQLLKQNVELNALKNVTCFSLAVGAEPSIGVLYDRWESSRGSASMISDGDNKQGSKVQITTLDTVLRDVRYVKLMKLDIEGFELEALKGAHHVLKRADPPMLIIECSADVHADHPAMLYNMLLSTNAFRFFKAAGGKERKSKLIEIVDESMLPSHDNIFVCTETQKRGLPKELFAN